LTVVGACDLVGKTGELLDLFKKWAPPEKRAVWAGVSARALGNALRLLKATKTCVVERFGHSWRLCLRELGDPRSRLHQRFCQETPSEVSMPRYLRRPAVADAATIHDEAAIEVQEEGPNEEAASATPRKEEAIEVQEEGLNEEEAPATPHDEAPIEVQEASAPAHDGETPHAEATPREAATPHEEATAEGETASPGEPAQEPDEMTKQEFDAFIGSPLGDDEGLRTVYDGIMAGDFVAVSRRAESLRSPTKLLLVATIVGLMAKSRTNLARWPSPEMRTSRPPRGAS